MQFLTSGKVKDIYDAGDGNLIFRFSDRVSAYDVEFIQDIPRKGEVLCKFAEYWFSKLDVKNHFVERQSATEIVVEQMEMFPIECVARGYLYGSFASRVNSGEVQLPDGAQNVLASRLASPIFDPSTKEKHDRPIDKDGAVSTGLVTSAQFDELQRLTLDVYAQMSEICSNAGFILCDLKLEFGKVNGEIKLGDSIGPDECRLWLKDAYKEGMVQESFDKQILRDWLAENGYDKKFKEQRASGESPSAPNIPKSIISKMTQKYIKAYEMITTQSMGPEMPSYE